MFTLKPIVFFYMFEYVLISVNQLWDVLYLFTDVNYVLYALSCSVCFSGCWQVSICFYKFVPVETCTTPVETYIYWKSVQIFRYNWRSLHILGNHLNSLIILANSCKSLEIHGHPHKSLGFFENPCKFLQILGNNWKSLQTNGHDWNSQENRCKLL